MKVHPLPKKRNNVTIQFYDHRGDPLVSSSVGSHHKKLRRLPHIFSRVLELPFRSDAEVSVEENPDCFRFVAETDNNIGEVRAHTVEIYPGVTKIVIRPNGYLELSPLADLELDMWRFRLPETTRPELASAVLADGELIVTVPKGEEVEEEGNGNNNNGEFRGEQGKWMLCVLLDVSFLRWLGQGFVCLLLSFMVPWDGACSVDRGWLRFGNICSSHTRRAAYA
ncbi:hypothetical protein DKX38_015382 [Salix brachista]|uniref:SHSP domain-containing protein n=1 Tax=Salix brachista TaxID=2182728 RepID=A0A5N5L529_9ROSI|nr:hypothetical protein DKX38_015382 [Salix brachista]